MKIAILVDRMVLGGLETHLVTLINELLLRDYQILLCTDVASPEIIAQIYGGARQFQHVSGLNLCEMPMRRFAPDIIHAHPFTAVRLGVNLSRTFRKPLVVTVHGLYDAGLGQPMARGQVADRVSRIIAVDDGVAAYLQAILPDPDKISVIYNGINVEVFFPTVLDPASRLNFGLNPDWFTITTVSRLDDDKSPPLFQLARCAGTIAARLGGVNVLMVGDGNMTAQLLTEADAAMAVNHNVRIMLAGRQSDVRPFIKAADIVLACDRSAMEAMACGRPVYAANGSGYAGIIDEANYRDILFYRRGYSPLPLDHLAERLIEAASAPGVLQRAARDGLDIINRHFDIREKANAMDHIYRTLQTPVPGSGDYSDPYGLKKAIKAHPIRISVHDKPQ